MKEQVLEWVRNKKHYTKLNFLKYFNFYLACIISKIKPTLEPKGKCSSVKVEYLIGIYLKQTKIK